jgi:hypothetical protein
MNEIEKKEKMENGSGNMGRQKPQGKRTVRTQSVTLDLSSFSALWRKFDSNMAINLSGVND